MNHTYQVFGMHLACYGRKDASIMAKSPLADCPKCVVNDLYRFITISDIA